MSLDVALNRVALNRSAYLKYLRENPNNRRQITGSLSDGENARCALGMCVDLIGKHVSVSGDYNEIAEYLGLDSLGLEEIWKMNDRLYFTFEQIANELEQEWQTGQ